MDHPLTRDEMPVRWVRAVEARIAAYGWTVRTADPDVLVVELTPAAADALAAGTSDPLVLGWPRGSVEWGIGTAPRHQLADDGSPGDVAARVDQLLRTGHPAPRAVCHAIPPGDIPPHCTCPSAHPCGGIVVTPDCPAHHARPAMTWHWERDCTPAAR